MCQEDESNRKHIVCPVEANKEIAVSVPVEVFSHAKVGDIELRCMGYQIEKDSDRRHCSKFKIVQRIDVNIPIKFFAKCEVGEERVDFDTQ